MRTTMACLLWEDSFYESGVAIADRIATLCEKVEPDKIMEIADKCKNQMHLRHTPLYLAILAIKNGGGTQEQINAVISRADGLGELLALYWKVNGKDKPIANRLKKALAKAFNKFDTYQLSKYANRGDIKLRDVMFLVHPKPIETMVDVYKKLASNTLEAPLTWEVELSAGKDKATTFLNLMKENKLGGLAFIRNLRNMIQAGIDKKTISTYSQKVNVDKILPYQFIAAANANPSLEDVIEPLMLKALNGMPKLPGKTVLLIDISGSMFGTKISQKSELDRFDAAAGLAILGRELCEESVVYSFSNNPVLVPNRRGFALKDAIKNSQSHGGTSIGASIREALAKEKNADRLIVFSDEQSNDKVDDPKIKSYMLNVASYQNGVGYNGSWTNITGFSENTFRYIQDLEISAV